MKVSPYRFWFFAAFVFELSTIFTATPASTAENLSRPKQLCIYYGWPSLINGSRGNIARATAEFEKCDITVLGDEIEHATHGDHSAAESIINALRQTEKEVFGYVDLGVATQNLPISSIQAYADEWRAMGVSGIFLDDAGYDYGVTRARQNVIVDYIHDSGMKVFMNAWGVDDALSDTDESGQWNPSHMAMGDIYLAEDWLVAGGKYQSLRDWAAKADKAQQYALTKGIRLAGVTTAATNKAVVKDLTTSKFKMGFYGAAMYNLSAWQWTDVGYSSGNDKLLFYDASSWNYGASFIDNAIAHLQNYKRHERRTDTGTIVVNGNGASSGTGSFVAN